MADAPKLKDYFTAEVIGEIGERICAVHPPFDTDTFVTNALGSAWEELTFTQRSRSIADALWAGIGLDVAATLDVLVAALPDELDDPEGVLNESFWCGRSAMRLPHTPSTTSMQASTRARP